MGLQDLPLSAPLGIIFHTKGFLYQLTLFINLITTSKETRLTIQLCLVGGQ
jgi:hypothetical protein